MSRFLSRLFATPLLNFIIVSSALLNYSSKNYKNIFNTIEYYIHTLCINTYFIEQSFFLI